MSNSLFDQKRKSHIEKGVIYFWTAEAMVREDTHHGKEDPFSYLFFFMWGTTCLHPSQAPVSFTCWTRLRSAAVNDSMLMSSD